jgi:membrane-associated phospholipid phosphatase
MVRLHFFWILALFCCMPGWSQDSTSLASDTIKMRRSDMLKYDGMSVLGGIKHTYLAPMHWEKGNWVTFGGVVAGTGILWLTDKETSDYFINQGSSVPDYLKDTGYYFGKPLYNYGITGTIYIVGILTKNQKIRETGVLLISSATAAGLLQSILKNAVGRARPVTGLGAATFEPFSKGEAYHSFPSGHAILSFTTAYAISKQFESPWIKGGIWAVGLLTPVSRLWAGAHWLSDVAVGMVISVATVESIDKYLNRERNYNPMASKKKISWNLQLTPKSIGIVGTY